MGRSWTDSVNKLKPILALLLLVIPAFSQDKAAPDPAERVRVELDKLFAAVEENNKMKNAVIEAQDLYIQALKARVKELERKLSNCRSARTTTKTNLTATRSCL